MTTDTDLQAEEERKRQLALSQSPAEATFYEGKTPVLGEEVTVQQPAGEIAAMPEAGGTTVPGPVLPAMPPYPNWPEFPEFNLTPPTFNFTAPGGAPTAPGAPDVPWWMKTLPIIEQGREALQDIRKLGAMPAEGAWPTMNPEQFSLFGGEEVPWYENAGGGGSSLDLSGLPSETPLGPGPLGVDPALDLGELPGVGESLPGSVGEYSLFGAETTPAENLAAAGTDVTRGGFNAARGMPAPGINLGTLIPAGLQTAGGIYSAVTADDPGQKALGAFNAAGGAASTAAALAPQALSALAPAGTAAGLVSLPLVLGPLIRNLTRQDTIRAPKGWTYVPGTGDSRGIGGYVINPATGVAVQYLGKGKWQYSDISKAGKPVPAEIMRKYGIEPTGDLAKQPGYQNLARDIMHDDITRSMQPGPDGTPAPPPSEAHQRAYFEEWREPYIQQIRSQHPNATEGEIWRLYTLTDWYQQELNMQRAWGPNGPPGEPSEGGTGASGAPDSGGTGGGAAGGGGAENY